MRRIFINSTQVADWDSGRARVRAGLGPGSGRDFQIILDIFRADIEHVNTESFLSFFLIFAGFFV